MISKTEILKIQNEIEAHAKEMGFDSFPVLDVDKLKSYDEKDVQSVKL